MFKNSIVLLFLLISSFLNAQVVPDFTASSTQVCAPNSVTFTVNPLISADEYFWEFSNGVTSNQKNPTIVFSTPALISVKLTVTLNGQQVVVNKRNFVSIFAPPTVDFIADKPLGCSPLQVNFTDLSVPNSAAIQSWFWSFGNGQTSTQQFPTTVYNEKRKHTVVLKVVDQNGCEATKVKNNYISLGGPEANFLHNDLLCRVPSGVAFTNTSKGNNLEYFWDFGDGKTSNAELPGTHTYTKFDNTFVELVVREKNSGCTDTMRKEMNIIDYQATFDFSISCNQKDFTINLTNTTKPFANKITWNLGDGSESTENDLIKKYNDVNPKIITLRAEFNETCWDTTRLYYTPSNPIFSFSSEQCNPPMIVSFENKSLGNNLTFLWNFNDNVYSSRNSTLENPIKQFKTPPDKHYVELQATDMYGCKRSGFANINAPYPIANFEAVNNKTSGCAPLTVSFIDTLSYILDSTEIASVYWNFGDPASGTQNISFETSPTHTFETPGDYTLTYAILLNNGCVDTLIVENFIRVGEKPDSVIYNSSLGDTICWGVSPQYSLKAFKNNQIFTTNYNCWLFEQNNGGSLLVNSETPPSDCGGPQSNFNRRALSVNHPNPIHDYIKYEYKNQDIINDELYLADAQSESGDKFTHLITGYNGCFTEVIRPKKIKDVMAMPGFVFPDKIQSLFFPDTSRLIKVFNASTNFESVNYFRLMQNNSNTLKNLMLEDTSEIKFTESGLYRIEIQVNNSQDACLNTTTRNILVENPILKLKFENNVCFSNQKFYVIDQSLFNTGTTTNRRWWVNDSLLLDQPNISNPRKDSVLLNVLDTGWNVVKLEIRRNYIEYLYGNSLDVVEYNYIVKDSIYISGSKGLALIDTNFICKGDSLYLKAQFSSTSTVDSLIWNYGNNSFSNRLDNHFFQFKQSGTIPLNYVIYNSDGCIDTINFDTLTVSGPNVDFLANDTLVCLYNEVNFKNLSKGNNLSYTWEIEGIEYFAIDPDHNFNQVGFHNIKLVATDKFGCMDSLTKINYIEIAPIPEVKFGTDQTLGECPPFNVNFIDSTLGNTTKWLWNFGDGNISTLKNPLHTFTSPAKYDVTLTVTNYANCSDSLKNESLITVLGPNGTVDLSDDKICLPDSLTLKGKFTDTEFYVWNFGNNIVRNFDYASYRDTVKYLYPKAGTFLPVLTLVDDRNCRYSPSLNLQVQVDSLRAKMSFNDTLICSLDGFVVENNSTITFPQNTRWDLGNGLSLLGNTAQINYTEEGTYNLKLVIRSQVGCIDSVIKSIEIFQKPEYNFDVISRDFCVPVKTQIKLNILSNDFNWNSKVFEVNGQTYENIVEIDANEVQKVNGKYELIYGNNQCKIDSVFSIQYYDFPTSNFEFSPKHNSVQSGPIQFKPSTQSQFPVKYSWDFKNGQQSNLTNPKIVFPDAGDYLVQLTVSNNGNCADTVRKNLVISPRDFVILPEAFTPNGDGIDDVFKVVYAGDLELVSLKIMNRWGNLLFESNVLQDGWDGRKNGKDEPNGSYVYFVVVKDKNGNLIEQKGNFALIR
jgi:gliding motility-associated-like protein